MSCSTSCTNLTSEVGITTKAYHSGQGDQRPVQRQVFAAVVRRLTLASSVDINNPFPRMGAGLSSWTKCRGLCQPDRANRPRDLVLVQSMYVGGGLPLLGGREPAKCTLGVVTPVLAHPQCGLGVAHSNRKVLHRRVVQHVGLLRLLNGL